MARPLVEHSVSVEVAATPRGERAVYTHVCAAHGPWHQWVWYHGPPWPLPQCPACRDEQIRRARLRRNAVRKPPRPPYEKEPGVCSMCGLTPLPGRRRSWCSDRCVDEWMIATGDTTRARVALAERDGAGCATCGHSAAARHLEVDHVRPLWSLTDHERTELAWWLLGNLQLLCTGCHKAKTAAEAAERADRVLPSVAEPRQPGT